MSSYTFYFDELPPTFNALNGRHWYAAHNAKRRWQVLLREQLGPDYHCPEPCEITVMWRVMHMQDYDNAHARFKVIGDALKRAGYISDDKPEILHLTVRQERVAHLHDQGFSMEVREYLPFSERVLSGEGG